MLLLTNKTASLQNFKPFFQVVLRMFDPERHGQISFNVTQSLILVLPQTSVWKFISLSEISIKNKKDFFASQTQLSSLLINSTCYYFCNILS